MGRTRWWHGAGLELLVLCILHRGFFALADGNVGCLFSGSACDSTETCYNDLAFGRCIPLYADVNRENLYRYDLDGMELELLRLELSKLENDGYKWSHSYTQCVIQTTLLNLRHGRPQDSRICHHLRMYPQPPLTPSSSGRFLAKSSGGRGIAQVDEYTPLNDLEEPPDRHRQYREHPYRLRLGATRFLDRGRKLQKKSLIARQIEHQAMPVSMPVEDVEGELFLVKALRHQLEASDANNDDDDHENNDGNGDNNDESGLEFLRIEPNGKDEQLDLNDDKYETVFLRNYKQYPKRKLEFIDEDAEYESEVVQEQEKQKKKEAELENDSPTRDNGMYMEGGVIRPSESTYVKNDGYHVENPYGVLFDDDLNELLWRRELAGFKRRERLDVKKPGPLFSTNNYAFGSQSSSTRFEERQEKNSAKQVNGDTKVSLTKKATAGVMTDPQFGERSSKTYGNVDLDHVYIEFRQEFRKWSEGARVVKKVAELLGLSPGSLRDVRVGRAEVTFKVVRNEMNLNASDVVDRIDGIRAALSDALKVEVVRAGIGDKTKLPATLEVSSIGSSSAGGNNSGSNDGEMSSSLFGATVAAGIAAAGAAAVVTLVIARRHAKSRAKLAGLATPDPEASKDYQDLCRARMQAKQPTQEQRQHPSAETRDAPSTRSSTSSWGDEVTLSNMDISTGHMVLSYMEDHLKNKDRLEQEWAALCAYEADPASTDIAERESNQGRNRANAVLPYDHSRVVLNDLANENNSDYVNASTITDHDPRNPAYIATQGPLPQTTADFWQLVWEQGSVVIVMLTRLTEEGRATCHRYWPEEGSELYHIYEVHLVSEHFWCDDYLVRSFYLKNLRTGETRTVTQFHFLSWPENGVPHSTKALLEFRRKVNKSYRGRSCPIVVHCSDGAGRTGTYCLIDMVLNRMAKGAKEIDIAATLEHIRDQRPHMVATKQQFEFVLMAVAEEVHAILKALPVVAKTTPQQSPPPPPPLPPPPPPPTTQQ